MITTGAGLIGAGASTAAGGGVITTGADMVGVGGDTAPFDVNGRASISATVLVSELAGEGDVTIGAGGGGALIGVGTGAGAGAVITGGAGGGITGVSTALDGTPDAGRRIKASALRS